MHHPHCELQHDHRHRLPQWSVRSSSATADSGRLCLTLPQRRFSPAASSNTPGLHRTHPKSTRPRVAVGRPDCGIRPHCEPSNPHSRLSLPGQHRRMPRFPPSRLVRRLPAWRHHVLARLRVKAGIAQPLTAADIERARRELSFTSMVPRAGQIVVAREEVGSQPRGPPS